MSFKYKITIFKELIEKYPEWNSLRSYLESDVGGMLRVSSEDENGLCIIKYEKNESIMTLPHSKWFRSVVWNTHSNRPVCVAPPKANADKLDDTIDVSNHVYQEFHDGFMINCFKEVSTDVMHITTRSKLDASGKFYSQKTFKELFLETIPDFMNGEFNTYVPDSSKCETAVFYSFLIQHPEHRIVKPIENPSIYIIHKGIVLNDGTIEIVDSPTEFNSVLSVKPIIELNNKDIKKYLLEKDWRFQGIVIKDMYGNRRRYRNDRYLAVKTLRGNIPNSIDRFSQLYVQNLVSEYVEYYPEDTLLIGSFMIVMDLMCKVTYTYYVSFHINKRITLDMIDKMFWTHLYNIHGIYLTKLRQENKKVSINDVVTYFHKQPWQRVAFIIKKLSENDNSV